MLEIKFADKNLDRLETDPRYNGGYSQAVVRAFRKVLQVLRAADDERDLYALKGMHFEKLSGNRSHQRSVRLNDQWRLILELKDQIPSKQVIVISIEDYH